MAKDHYFDISAKLGAQSLAYDFLKRGDELLLLEISYTYISHLVQKCPGHWDAQLNWHEGHMWPEEAHAQDLLARLDHKHGA